MRIPVIVTVTLVAFAAALGWQNHETLTSLRAERRSLAGKAAAQGMVFDTSGKIRFTKRPREDRAAEARRVATDFITYATEMSALAQTGESPDKATRERMMRQMDEVLSLDAAQLRILIGQVVAARDIDPTVRVNLLAFSLERLTTDHPRDALEMLTPEMREILGPDSGLTANLVHAATLACALEKPNVAHAWYREHQFNLTPEVLKSVRSTLITGTGNSDLRLALDLTAEFGGDPADTVPGLIGRDGQTSAEKMNSLAVLRDWTAGTTDEAAREKVFSESLFQLILGKGGGSADFQSVSRWVADAGLSDSELALLTRRDLLDLTHHVKPEQTGQWAVWLANHFSAEASGQIWNLFEDWSRSDRASVVKWLDTVPDGLARSIGIHAYAKEIAREDPSAAIRWAMRLPPGRKREETLESIHQSWPKDDTAGKAAFAGKYGIE